MFTIMMAALAAALGSGFGNIAKNRLGQWVGWNGARLTAKLLRQALGEDADSALDLIVQTGAAGEFGTAAAARFLTDQFKSQLSPGQAWLLQAILGNISEHIYPEFVEEIARIREVASTDRDAALSDAGNLWSRMVERAFASVNPSGETGTLRYLMPLGGTTTYYAPGHGTGAFDRQKAAYDAAGYGQHYLHVGSRPADTRALSVGHHGLVYFEGEATFDEALADPNGQLCRADFPLIERAMQAQLKAKGGGESAWNRLTEAQRTAVLDNESRLMLAVTQAEHAAEHARRAMDLDPMTAFLASHAETIRDSANQMRDCTDFGLLRMLAEVQWPADLPDTATDAERALHVENTRLALHQTFSAIDRIGDQASADRRAEQAVDNLRRWAQQESRRLGRSVSSFVGRVVSHPLFYLPALLFSALAAMSALAGFVLIVWNVAAKDLVSLADVPGRIEIGTRVGAILAGLVLTLPLAGVLYAFAGIVEQASGILKAMGRTASAVGSKIFGIEVAPPLAEDVFGRGRYFQRFAAGYLLVVLLLVTITLGTFEVDFFLCAHALSWGFRLVVVILLLGGGVVKAAGDLAKGLSAAANQDLERNARRTFGWLQLIPAKAFALLVIVAPLALPVVHVTGVLKTFQRFQDEAIEYATPGFVLMPTGKSEAVSILGGRQITAKVCSNNRIHLASGRPVNTNDWRFDREWNGVLLAVFTGMDLLKGHVDATTTLPFLDGFSGVTLESAFPGATLDVNNLVKVDPARSAEFLSGTPDENFVVQTDGFVRVEPRPAEPSAASAAGVSAFLGRTPGYAFWVLAAVFLLISIFSLPERQQIQTGVTVPGSRNLVLVKDMTAERSVRFTVSGICLLASVAIVVAWFIRASIVG